MAQQWVAGCSLTTAEVVSNIYPNLNYTSVGQNAFVTSREGIVQRAIQSWGDEQIDYTYRNNVHNAYTQVNTITFL